MQPVNGTHVLLIADPVVAPSMENWILQDTPTPRLAARALGLWLRVAMFMLIVLAPAPTTANGSLAPRLLHYTLECNPSDRCQIDCFQDGRTILSSVRMSAGDRASLVLSDGFSDRLKPMWIEVRPRDKRGYRTVLIPPAAMCDLQGITVRPLAP